MKCIISSFILCVLLAACSTTDKDNMLHIREQGSFLVGGSVVTAPGTYDEENPTVPDGQTLHGDHAYVFYQIPDKARRLPLVFQSLPMNRAAVLYSLPMNYRLRFHTADRKRCWWQTPSPKRSS